MHIALMLGFYFLIATELNRNRRFKALNWLY